MPWQLGNPVCAHYRRHVTPGVCRRGAPCGVAPLACASPASPGKRRLSTEPLDGETAPAVDDVASPPQPKRAAPSAPPSAGLRQGFLLR